MASAKRRRSSGDARLQAESPTKRLDTRRGRIPASKYSNDLSGEGEETMADGPCITGMLPGDQDQQLSSDRKLTREGEPREMMNASSNNVQPVVIQPSSHVAELVQRAALARRELREEEARSKSQRQKLTEYRKWSSEERKSRTERRADSYEEWAAISYDLKKLDQQDQKLESLPAHIDMRLDRARTRALGLQAEAVAALEELLVESGLIHRTSSGVKQSDWDEKVDHAFEEAYTIFDN